MDKRKIFLSALLASAMAANAQVNISVDAANPGVKVSPNLYGIFFENTIDNPTNSMIGRKPKYRESLQCKCVAGFSVCYSRMCVCYSSVGHPSAVHRIFFCMSSGAPFFAML